MVSNFKHVSFFHHVLVYKLGKVRFPKNSSRSKFVESCFFFSGYGSQALSSNTLSSDDSMSLRSISVDGTPDMEVIPKINEDLKAKVSNLLPSEAQLVLVLPS